MSISSIYPTAQTESAITASTTGITGSVSYLQAKVCKARCAALPCGSVSRLSSRGIRQPGGAPQFLIRRSACAVANRLFHPLCPRGYQALCGRCAPGTAAIPDGFARRSRINDISPPARCWVRRCCFLQFVEVLRCKVAAPSSKL